MKIKKILIANRGEIACRIIRTCKDLGIETVAIYSEADLNALHTQLADEAVLIGPAQASQSYLDMDAVISAALEKGVDAIHPGYGFLSENPDFAQKVIDSGLIFIGPSPAPMRLLGSKTASRRTMIDAGVPIIEGMQSGSKDFSLFQSTAEKIGYPVLLKAAAGGGGKGMRIVKEASELQHSIEAAMRESLAAFGSDEIYLEKYIEEPRHIEFQIAADTHGNAVHIFERECSIQRRHQKIIEETPSPALNDELRALMGETAVKAVKAANYDNIGTVEFLLDKNNHFYFLEVNARIQVEHPITEMITGIDLVKLQIEIAEGNRLPYTQNEIAKRGHAFECRIYAEDPDHDFMPSAGKILFMKEPSGPGVRYDSGIKTGSDVPVYYDPILAKLITYAENREDSRRKMIQALKNNPILGVKTSIDFMINILEHPDFVNGELSTSFIEIHKKELKDSVEFTEIALALASVYESVPQIQKMHHYNNSIEIGAWQLWRNNDNS